jgi:hypothetical protein
VLGGAPELGVIVAASLGRVVEGVLPPGRSPIEVAKDQANRARRQEAYEAYGSAVILTWQAAGTLLTFRPKLQGYLHGLAALVRAQRRFEEQNAGAAGALSSILLYGSSETQQAAVSVAGTLGKQLSAVASSGNQGSPEVFTAYGSASVDLGNAVVAWRKAAQADLGM